MAKITQRIVSARIGDIEVDVYCDGDGIPTRARSGGIDMSAAEWERIAAVIVEIRRAEAVDGWAVQVCAEHGYWRLGGGVNKCPKCEAPTEVQP